jgi:CreA protein
MYVYRGDMVRLAPMGRGLFGRKWTVVGARQAVEVSDISLACRQIGPIHFKRKFAQGEDMFRQRRSLFFKKMQIVRGCDPKRNVLVYMVYSDKLIEGSPKNSTSSVPIMPWGARDQVEKCADWIEN